MNLTAAKTTVNRFADFFDKKVNNICAARTEGVPPPDFVDMTDR